MQLCMERHGRNAAAAQPASREGTRLQSFVSPLVLAAALTAALTTAAAAIAAAPLEPGYAAGIEQWRRDFDADVRTGGWLTLVDRVPLAPGSHRIGSGADCEIRLPAPAPRWLGTLLRQGDSFRFDPAGGAEVLLDEAWIHRDSALGTAPGTGRLRAGRFELHARRVGDDFYLFVIDEQSPAIARFQGNDWYPIDPAYRIAARFEPYATAQKVRVPLSHVDSKEEMTSSGDVVLELAGRAVRLKTFTDDTGLFIMFQDATNGVTTYGGGRFLEAPAPKEGMTVLDFNKSFNPYCSLNPNVLCPIPPPENRLDLEVRAGEKFRGEPP